MAFRLDAKAITTRVVLFADSRKELKDDDRWMAKQVYLQRRQFPAGRSGDGSRRRADWKRVDFAILDEEFDLKAQATPAWWWSRSATIA